MAGISRRNNAVLRRWIAVLLPEAAVWLQGSAVLLHGIAAKLRLVTVLRRPIARWLRSFAARDGWRPEWLMEPVLVGLAVDCSDWVEGVRGLGGRREGSVLPSAREPQAAARDHDGHNVGLKLRHLVATVQARHCPARRRAARVPDVWNGQPNGVAMASAHQQRVRRLDAEWSAN